ncbi:uncharacterized protein LOC144103947 [Amblyomma americanum]
MTKGVWLALCLALLAAPRVSSEQETAVPSKTAEALKSQDTAAASPDKSAQQALPPEKISQGDIQEATPYEEDPTHLERQRMEDFINITERIYVVQRNFKLKEGDTCESAQRLRQLNDREYEYVLRGRHARSMESFMTMKTTFTVSKTGIHKEYNAVTYQHGMGASKVERKLMYISPEKTCAILVEPLKKGRKGCQLVQPESTVDNGIPEDCRRVYKAHCGKRLVTIYNPVCKGLPDRFPHEEL